MEHEWFTPDCVNGDWCPGCMWCSGGLETCKVCRAFEGATPDKCPGKPMTYEMSDLVYKGIINFRDGNWYGECAGAMRHIHDTDNFMREAGYVRNGVNKAGNPAWKKGTRLKSND